MSKYNSFIETDLKEFSVVYVKYLNIARARRFSNSLKTRLSTIYIMFYKLCSSRLEPLVTNRAFFAIFTLVEIVQKRLVCLFYLYDDELSFRGRLERDRRLRSAFSTELEPDSSLPPELSYHSRVEAVVNGCSEVDDVPEAVHIIDNSSHNQPENPQLLPN